MIVGDTFNATGFTGGRWNIRADAGVAFAATEDSAPASMFYGAPSESMQYVSGTGLASLSNRGLGNAGMALVAGMPYEGFLFAKVRSAASAAGADAGDGAGAGVPVSLTVGLENFVTGTPLASTVLVIAPTPADDEGQPHADETTNGFVRYNFTLTPTASTGCTPFHCSSPAREGGAFYICHLRWFVQEPMPPQLPVQIYAVNRIFSALVEAPRSAEKI
jgi:hypothetical protein